MPSVRAEQPFAVIGFLCSSSPDGYADMVAAFDRGLAEAGYVDGWSSLREIVPSVKTIAQLVNPANPALSEAEANETRNAAAALGINLHLFNASKEADIGAAFDAIEEIKAGALLVGSDPLFFGHRTQLAAAAARHSIPTMYFGREYPAAGGLMSYGGSLADSYQRAGVFVGRVLKGEKPSELPVEQLTIVKLVFNLSAAKALGLNIPLSLLGRADEVIE
jgi:putative ABC transport system substrate-binding protein